MADGIAAILELVAGIIAKHLVCTVRYFLILFNPVKSVQNPVKSVKSFENLLEILEISRKI